MSQTHHVVTGSATADGSPIYLTRAGTWSPRVEQADLLDEATARDRAGVAAQRGQAIVCDPYVITVALTGETVVPSSLKERIRANGPTVTFGVHA